LSSNPQIKGGLITGIYGAEKKDFFVRPPSKFDYLQIA